MQATQRASSTASSASLLLHRSVQQNIVQQSLGSKSNARKVSPVRKRWEEFTNRFLARLMSVFGDLKSLGVLNASDCGPGLKTDGSSASLSVPPPSNASLQHGYREYRNSDGNNGWGSPSFLQASRVPVARCVYILFISSLPKMTFRRMICPPTMSLLNSDNWNIRT